MQPSSSSDTRKRFPRIHHIQNGPLKGGGVTRDDIVLSGKEAETFFNFRDAFTPKEQEEIENSINNYQIGTREKTKWSVVVQEKVDGANMGIFFDTDARSLAVQNRSHRVVANSGSQWKGLDGFLQNVGPEILELLFALPKNPTLKEIIGKRRDTNSIPTNKNENNNKSSISAKNDDENDDDKNQDNGEENEEELLAGEWTLYGEWLLARHSVAYDSLPSPFLAFDIHHAPTDTFLSTEIVKRLLAKFCPSIHMVPTLASWNWNDDNEKEKEKKSENTNGETDKKNNNDDNSSSQSKAIASSTTVTDRRCADGPSPFIVPKLNWDKIHQVYHNKPSKFSGNATAARCEGAMVRLEVNGILHKRCKAVHDEFRAAIDDHWTAKEMVKNGVVVG